MVGYDSNFICNVSTYVFKYGRDILAVGGNRTAARLSGINVDWIIISCNILSCVFACLAAILWASRTGTASPNTGSDWMMYSIAVCAIGRNSDF